MQLKQTFQIGRHEMVALVGGGGKSSAMFRLGRELAAAGQRTLLTTTTRLATAQIRLAPAHLIVAPEEPVAPGEPPLDRLVAQLERLFADHNPILLTGPAEAETEKLWGLRPALVDALARSHLAPVIVNEADGAKKKPFKAPAAYEPVIPTETSLVVPMVGLDILGRPLEQAQAHRVEQISRLSGLEPGQTITAEVVAAVMTHPEGGLRNIPPAARIIPLLNKLDLVDPVQADQLAGLILANPAIQAVALGSLQAEEPVQRVENRVAAIILAAGRASRFGSPKQLALWQGKPLLAHTLDAVLASRAKPVIVVLGAEAEACRAVIGSRPVEIVYNERWAEGQSTSMKAGLAALPSTVSAALFPLADQPFVNAADIEAVIRAYQSSLAPIVWPEYEGQRGNPVLFDRRLFPEMALVTGDTGARPVLQAHRAEAQPVPVSNAGVLRDIDTPDDLRF